MRGYMYTYKATTAKIKHYRTTNVNNVSWCYLQWVNVYSARTEQYESL